MKIEDIVCHQYAGIRAHDTNKYVAYIRVEMQDGILSVYVNRADADGNVVTPRAYILGASALEFIL